MTIFCRFLSYIRGACTFFLIILSCYSSAILISIYSKKKKISIPMCSIWVRFIYICEGIEKKSGIAVAEECFLEYWNSYIQLGFSWFFLCLLVLFLQLILLHPCTCPKVILSVFSIWKQELRGNKKDNRMYQLSFKVVGFFFFFFLI